MDYTNFVKTYYRSLIKKINKFSYYFGFALDSNRGIIFDENYHIVKEKYNLFILPRFELNIDAPLKKYEEFFNYYSKAYPQLSIAFLNSESMVGIYNLAVEKNIINDDYKVIEYIDVLIDMSLETLKESGVLA